jgi:hypothetical protein
VAPTQHILDDSYHWDAMLDIDDVAGPRHPPTQTQQTKGANLFLGCEPESFYFIYFSNFFITLTPRHSGHPSLFFIVFNYPKIYNIFKETFNTFLIHFYRGFLSL